MRYLREALPIKWAALFMGGEETVIISTVLSDREAELAKRLIQARCVGPVAVLLMAEMLTALAA